MSIQLIQQYHAQVEKIIRYGGTRKESSVRKPFQDLLEAYARQKNLEMIAELDFRTGKGHTIYPDGTLKDALRQDWGYWESKDEADKETGVIQLDTTTTLSGIPLQAWEYKLGNRSAIEWVLDRYKERKPKDPTIREKFNTYRFADYKEDVVELVGRVTAVSVATMKIINHFPGNSEFPGK